jgi:hypothetical protein
MVLIKPAWLRHLLPWPWCVDVPLRPVRELAYGYVADRNESYVQVTLDDWQRAMVKSDMLPINIRTHGGLRALQTAGIKFRDRDTHHGLLTFVQLPAGWRKKADPDNKYYVRLLDVHNNRRASVYYKNSGPGSSAHMDVHTRYQIIAGSGPEEDGPSHQCTVIDNKTGKVYYTTAAYPYDGYLSEESIRLAQKARNEATLWLDDCYPDWEDLNAYWP